MLQEWEWRKGRQRLLQCLQEAVCRTHNFSLSSYAVRPPRLPRLFALFRSAQSCDSLFPDMQTSYTEVMEDKELHIGLVEVLKPLQDRVTLGPWVNTLEAVSCVACYTRVCDRRLQCGRDLRQHETSTPPVSTCLLDTYC